MAWWLPLLALGAGYVAGSSGSSGGSQPQAPERMNYEDALKQAEEAMRPQYEKSRERVLSDVDRSLISRGFYGQAPGDAFKARTMANMESDFQGQLAQAATNLQNSQYMQDYQTYQTQLQYGNQVDPFWQTIGGIAGLALGGPAGGAVGGWLGDKIGSWLE